MFVDTVGFPELGTVLNVERGVCTSLGREFRKVQPHSPNVKQVQAKVILEQNEKAN